MEFTQQTQISFETRSNTASMAKRKQLGQGNAGKKVKVAKKVEEEQPESDNDSDGSDAEASSEAESSSKEEANDGLADMMSKILNQNTGSKVGMCRKYEPRRVTETLFYPRY
jgi:protein required for attachment to host cells